MTEEDHLYFKQVAQQAGLYCSNYGIGSESCQRAGTSPCIDTGTPLCTSVGGALGNGDVTGLGNFFVVYIEYPAGTDPQSNMLTWNATTPAPSNTCGVNPPAANMMVLMIVRNGGFENTTNFMGAVFAEDGRFEVGGNVRFEGTIAASFIRSRGTPTICNSQRWLDSMPGAFMQVAPLQWSEVDR